MRSYEGVSLIAAERFSFPSSTQMFQLERDMTTIINIFDFDFIALRCMMWYYLSKGNRSITNTTL